MDRRITAYVQVGLKRPKMLKVRTLVCWSESLAISIIGVCEYKYSTEQTQIGVPTTYILIQKDFSTNV